MFKLHSSRLLPGREKKNQKKTISSFTGGRIVLSKLGWERSFVGKVLWLGDGQDLG